MRCSGLERSRRGKMFYCNIRTPVHRIAIPKVMWLLYPKFWVQTFGIATLWTGVSVFCNLHTAFPLNFPVCVPRPRSVFDCHRSRFRSCYPAIQYCYQLSKLRDSSDQISAPHRAGAANGQNYTHHVKLPVRYFQHYYLFVLNSHIIILMWTIITIKN